MVHVAAEMEREGFDIPLLIGGATTSRVHTAVKIHPRYDRGADGLCQRREPRGRRGRRRCCRARRSDGYVAQRARRIPQGRRRARAQRSARSSACRSPRRAPTRCKLDWAAYEPPTPSFLGTRVFDDYDLAELARYIDWTPFFQTWELKGRYPGDPRRSEAGRGGARSSSTTRRRCCGEIVEQNVVHARRRWSASGRPTPSATTSGSSPTRARDDGARDALHAAPAARQARRAAECGARRFRRAGRSGTRLCRRLRRHRRHRGRRSSPSASSTPTTTTPRSWSRRSADRFAEAFAEAMHAARPARALGLCAGRGLHARRADRASPIAASARRPAIRRSPTIPRRRRCSACSTPSARSGVKLTESFAMWPGSSVSGLYLRPPRGATISASPRSSATRSRTMPRARAWRSPRSSAGSAPILNYIPVKAQRGGVANSTQFGAAADAFGGAGARNDPKMAPPGLVSGLHAGRFSVRNSILSNACVRF